MGVLKQTQGQQDYSSHAQLLQVLPVNAVNGGIGHIFPGEYLPVQPYLGDHAVYDENGNLISRDPPEIDPMDETVRIRYSYDWSYGESNAATASSSSAFPSWPVSQL